MNAEVTCRVRATPLLVEAEAGPIGLEDALASLGRVRALPVPAKAALPAAGSPRLLAEVPNDGGGEWADHTARAALAAGLAWLAGQDGGAQAEHATEIGAVEEALDAMPWPWAATGEAAYRLLLPVDVVPARVHVTALAHGGVRVALSPTAVRAAGARGAHAVRLFALEANARLRLVRLAVSSGPDGIVGVEQQVILPGGTPLARWLVEAVHALAAAHAEIGAALHAFAAAPVAEAYLAARAQGH